MALKILLTGYTGGIGTAIKESLKEHNVWGAAHANFESNEEFDWLICAHGVIDETDVLETFKANVISQISLIQSIKAKNIIMISSTSALKGNDRFPAYSASKTALNMYCKLISGKRNCYVICPGPTDTPMWRKLGLEGQAQDPKEVAKAVEYVMAGNCKSGDIITVRNGIII